ncbi:MAG: hypothetical protein COB69_04775 [Phycisphaera sp.]|nr:MAG: hypothetical protein COB69_04775 [Phycisphaera sp.]
MADDYLKPYEEAVKAGGTGFESLLWRNKKFQLVRFRVLCEVAAAGLQKPDVPASLDKLTGRVIADMGCGRADLCQWLGENGVEYGKYIGVEGIGDLAEVCRRRIVDEKFQMAEVVESDFAADPRIFESLVKNHGTELFLFSGSLNTFEQSHAIEVIANAFNALGTNGGVVFNFLSDLVRDPPSDDTGPAQRFDTLGVFKQLSKLTGKIALRHDYLSGHDATIGIFR